MITKEFVSAHIVLGRLSRNYQLIIVICVNEYKQQVQNSYCRRPNMEIQRLDSTGQDECSWADRDEIGEDEDVFAAIK